MIDITAQARADLIAVSGRKKTRILVKIGEQDRLSMARFQHSIVTPGGIMIFETPNPGNVMVGSNNFYLDPTHRNPLPGALVKYIAETRGFTDTELLYLHPVNEEFLIKESSEVSRRFNELFYGPQDYAIIARKPPQK